MAEKNEEPQPQPPSATPPSRMRRLLWLLACASIGTVTGFIGFHFTANQAWFLALPVTLAIGWLIFANPDECMRQEK